MLQPGDQEIDDLGWFDWWAALYCDESFAPVRRTEDDEHPAVWDDDYRYLKPRFPGSGPLRL